MSDLSSDQLLLIGYGNPLRRDDGVGPRVVEAVAALNLAGVSVIVQHQLVPELAEAISGARTVIFVDGSAKAGDGVGLDEIHARDVEQTLAHTSDPRSLLALTKQIFGRSPPAWSLAIPVKDLGFGEGLSPEAQDGLEVAVRKIQAFYRAQRID